MPEIAQPPPPTAPPGASAFDAAAPTFRAAHTVSECYNSRGGSGRSRTHRCSSFGRRLWHVGRPWRFDGPLGAPRVPRQRDLRRREWRRRPCPDLAADDNLGLQEAVDTHLHTVVLSTGALLSRADVWARRRRGDLWHSPLHLRALMGADYTGVTPVGASCASKCTGANSTCASARGQTLSARAAAPGTLFPNGVDGRCPRSPRSFVPLSSQRGRDKGTMASRSASARRCILLAGGVCPGTAARRAYNCLGAHAARPLRARLSTCTWRIFPNRARPSRTGGRLTSEATAEGEGNGDAPAAEASPR